MKGGKPEMPKTSFQWVSTLTQNLFMTKGFASSMGSPLPDDKLFPGLNTGIIDAEKHLRPPHLIPPKISRSSTYFDEILKCMTPRLFANGRYGRL